MLTRERSNRPTATATALRGCALKRGSRTIGAKLCVKPPAVGLTMTGNLWLAPRIPHPANNRNRNPDHLNQQGASPVNPAHHLNRSRHYLNFIPANIAAGDYARAARALCRSVSHAVTAAAVHWHHRCHTRQRLRLVVKALVFDGPLSIAGERAGVRGVPS